jgi:hypothetical protein
MIHRLVLSALLVAARLFAYAQGEDNSLKGVPVKDRIVTGGGFGLSFSSYQDYLSLSPVLGYSLTKKVIVGTSITYRYTNYKYYHPSVKLHDYAIAPFIRYTVYKGFFLQGEYEHLNYEYPVSAQETTRMTFNSVLGGGGLIQPIGDKATFYIMALYNFSYTAGSSLYTPYTSPFILRVGVNVGRYLGFSR